MAEEKKSFVLYTSYKKLVDRMSDEEAGILFKAILAQVTNGEIPELPARVDSAFVLIQDALVRDCEKWEQVKQKRAEAGKRSGEARRRKANAQCVEQSGTKRTNVQCVEQSGTKRTNVQCVEQSGTKRTVNVNDNVLSLTYVNDNTKDGTAAEAAAPSAEDDWLEEFLI